MLKTSSIRSVISIQYRVVTDRKTERYTMTMPLESDRLPRQRYLSDSLSFFHSSITMNHFHNLTQYCTIVCYEELANNKWFTFCIQHNITISGWPSVIWHCWLSGRKGIQPVKKTEWWGVGMVICLKRGADLHTAQLMSLPLTVSCFSKIQICFTSLAPAHPGSHSRKKDC